MREDRVRPLTLVYKKNGFTYIKVFESDVLYLYAQWSHNVVKDRYSLLVGFEVFYRRSRKERILDGKYIPAAERFPHDEAFGIWAWSLFSYERAVNEFTRLNQMIHKDARK